MRLLAIGFDLNPPGLLTVTDLTRRGHTVGGCLVAPPSEIEESRRDGD
jgi:hypothetical protein